MPHYFHLSRHRQSEDAVATLLHYAKIVITSASICVNLILNLYTTLFRFNVRQSLLLITPLLSLGGDGGWILMLRRTEFQISLWKAQDDLPG